MNYRIKDLIISIVPDKSVLYGCDPSNSACTGKCSVDGTGCTMGCSNTDTKFCGTPTSKQLVKLEEMLMDPADVLEMKSMLEHVVTRLDPSSYKSQDKMDSREVKLLEEKLNAVLTALKKFKK